MRNIYASVFLGLALLFSFAAAQECTWEVEPNDKPHEATIITGAGPDSALLTSSKQPYTVCLAGEMAGGDQDIFLWEVAQEHAGRRWAIDLFGADGILIKLNLLQLTFAENELDVTSRTDLLTLETMSSGKISTPEFVLEPGHYFIGLSKAGGDGEYMAHLQPGDLLSRGARRYREGSAQGGDFSFYGPELEDLELTWELDEEDAQFVWSITLETPLRSRLELELIGEAGQITKLETDVTGRARLTGLGLEAGTYTLRVLGKSGAFRLEAAKDGRVGDGVAVKPDNNPEQATHLPLGTEMSGSVTSAGDYFRISVDENEAEQAWQLVIAGSATLRANLELEDGTIILQRRRIDGRVDDLRLAAGVYYLKVQAANGTDYTVSLKPAESPQDGWEVEPNDAVASATPLGESQQVRGTLEAMDSDVFSFTVSGETQLYRLQLISQGMATLKLLNDNGREIGSIKGDRRSRLDNVALTPGKHYFEVSGDEGEYAVRLLSMGAVPGPPTKGDLPPADEPLVPGVAAQEAQPLEEVAEAPAEAELLALPPPPPGVLELEPNDDESRADRIIPGVPRVGTLPNVRDVDVYRFFLAEDQPVRVELVPPANGEPLRFDLSQTGAVHPARDAEPGTTNTTEQWLKAGDHYIKVNRGTTGDAWYQLRVTLLNGALPWDAEEGSLEAEDGPITITLTGEEAELGAYLTYGQEFTATATLENSSGESHTVELTAHTSDARLSLEMPDSVEIEAHVTADVTVKVTAPADLRDDVPIRLNLAATTAAGSSGATLGVDARCMATPVNPSWHWPLPEELLGGIDVLWDGLGATIHRESSRKRSDPLLIDGRANPAGSGRFEADNYPEFQLAGDEPVEVIGALLHPLAERGVLEQLNEFRIETSLDGEEFTTVYQGELKAARIEQSFLFAESVLARYARLVPLSSHGGTKIIRLGEFKLIAREAAPFGSHDLADPKLGGHVVWSDPYVNRGSLGSQWARNDVDLRGVDEFTFVLGFHNGRAAQITQLEWAGDLHERHEPFKGVSVEVSLSGAAGPWEPLTQWQFERDEEGRATLELEEPTWVRYLRFTAEKTDEAQRNWQLPSQLSVIEREASEAYRSALGEWGMASRAGIYEHLNPPVIPDTANLDSGNGSRERALVLGSGESAEGTVLIGANDAWHRLRIEDGHNHLQVAFSGEPFIGYNYELTASDGSVVDWEVVEDHQGVTLSFQGKPGDYYLKLSEPKRNVIFSWDTSGSMGAYLPITYNTLAAFVAAVDGDKESIQLLAYDSPRPQWLLHYWSSDRERLQQAVTSFDRSASSSNSEQAMLLAARALADRKGSRTLLLITDAETTGSSLSTEVWRALEETRMRVFTFEVNSYGSLYSQQFMQDWAAANDGIYSLATTIGDLEMGHDRVSCLLDSPKQYRVTATSSSVPSWEKASAWAEAELGEAQRQELIPDALIGVDLTANITRAEFAAVAVRAYENLSGRETVPVAVNPFTDTNDPDVLKAFNSDLAVGISASEFEPDTLLNREQAATILTRVVKKVSLPGWTWDSDADYELEFTQPELFADDQDISAWARDSVYFMAANEIIAGTGENMFSPRAITPDEQANNYASATREQALVLAVRMVENLGDH